MSLTSLTLSLRVNPSRRQPKYPGAYHFACGGMRMDSYLPWRRYPEGLAGQLNVAKKVVRKSPEFKKFHSFLVYETEVVSSPRSLKKG